MVLELIGRNFPSCFFRIEGFLLFIEDPMKRETHLFCVLYN